MLNFIFAMPNSPWFTVSDRWRTIKPDGSRKNLTTDSIYLTPYWRVSFFIFCMYNSFILAICKGFCLTLCFIRCCVNVALYTWPVEINTAEHCRCYICFVGETDMALSQMNWHHVSPLWTVHLNVVISECHINIRAWQLCSRLHWL